MKSKDLMFHQECGYGILTMYDDGSLIVQYSGDSFSGYVTKLDGWEKVPFTARDVPDDLIDEVSAAVKATTEEHNEPEPPKGTRIRINVAENDLEYHVYFRYGDKWVDENGYTYTWRDLKNLTWEEV